MPSACVAWATSARLALEAIVSLRPVNSFTVDLEDWFQGLTSTNPRVDAWPSLESRVVAATMPLLDLLDRHLIKATFFVLGHVAEHHPGLVQQVRDRGHEIGLHGYFHRFVNRLTPDEFAREVDRGMEAIQRATGQVPVGHRAPYFSIDRSAVWAFDVLRERGFRYDSSVFPTRSLLYGYPGARRQPHRVARNGQLVEFPASTLRLAGYNVPMAGGFYMRAWPYPFVRWAIRRLHREGLPAIIYLHPWELDIGQPRIRVTPRERVTHFYGRRGLQAKLERLFIDFTFAPLAELLGTVAN